MVAQKAVTRVNLVNMLKIAAKILLSEIIAGDFLYPSSCLMQLAWTAF